MNITDLYVGQRVKSKENRAFVGVATIVKIDKDFIHLDINGRSGGGALLPDGRNAWVFGHEYIPEFKSVNIWKGKQR